MICGTMKNITAMTSILSQAVYMRRECSDTARILDMNGTINEGTASIPASMMRYPGGNCVYRVKHLGYVDPIDRERKRAEKNSRRSRI